MHLIQSIMKINSICIVGGGSSGWMMALALNKKLPNLNVTLIESPDVKPIGVGESTIPYTANFFVDVLGLKEKEWMPRCNATYKASIKFNDFYKKGETFYHPFWTKDEGTYNGYDWAIKQYLTNLNKPDNMNYYSSSYIAYHMSKHNKFDRLNDESFSYAHHMDANKFGEYCKTKFEGKHILSNVKHVKVNGSTIVSVTTEKETIEADMFVDCTGFKALLIGKALHEPFVSYKNTLLNDTALTCQIKYTNKKTQIEPYTDCTALSSGWAWNIPLWHRVGSGYVFSSKFQTLESAKKEYKKYLKNRFGSDSLKNIKFNTIKIKTGKYKRGWVGNCLSLTLASGFIEPLESTGLALACYQIKEFVETISNYEYSSFNKSLYNNDLDKTYNEIHNFVLLHYINTTREDSEYWSYLKNNIDVPNSVHSYLNEDASKSTWFPEKSKECITIGLNIPSKYKPSKLSWNNIRLQSYTKKDQAFILYDLKYIEEREKYYENKIKTMSNLTEYLNNNIYI